jgi:protein-S-isoprenylcysteine O-methyltransferase Ste14
VGFLQKRLKPRLWALYLGALALFVWAEPTPGLLVAGAAVVAAGEGIRLWATGHLHKNDALTVTGPYGFVRNPLYLGSLLIVTGFAVMSGTALAFGVYAAFLLFFFIYYMPYKSRIEGARLERLYGDAFRRYSAAVPSLLPRIHRYRCLADDRPAEVEWRHERFVDNDELRTAAVVGVGVLAMVARWGLG